MPLIVFDLDGTLIDSRRDLADAANALIAERGGTPLSEEAVGRMVGDGAAMLVRRALTAAGLTPDDASLPRFLALYDERLVQTTRPYPGMRDALMAIQSLGVLAVLTNKPLDPSERLLRALHLAPFFATVVGGDGPFPRKPDPQGLRHLMTTHAVPPDRTILVGDSWIDAATATSAGTRFCLARYGFGADEAPSAADTAVETPADLPAALAPLLR
ncbi:MAG: HAD-IA family hydrolase [Acidimicrobiia bacterium]|nr:HAD-IA family hydrolase [Acidimicrobiia bacterium]